MPLTSHLSLFVCLFVCLFNRLLRAETHLGPDGTRLKQNAQARLQSLYKHAGQLVYENVKKLRNSFEVLYNVQININRTSLLNLFRCSFDER